VFPTRQWSEIEDYVKIYAISGDPYDPYETDKHLPKEHRQCTVCIERGRQAQDCWAMESMVNFNPPFNWPSYVYIACVYCSTGGFYGDKTFIPHVVNHATNVCANTYSMHFILGHKVDMRRCRWQSKASKVSRQQDRPGVAVSSRFMLVWLLTSPSFGGVTPLFGVWQKAAMSYHQMLRQVFS